MQFSLDCALFTEQEWLCDVGQLSLAKQTTWSCLIIEFKKQMCKTAEQYIAEMRMQTTINIDDCISSKEVASVHSVHKS